MTLRKFHALLLSFVLFVSAVFPVYATTVDEPEDTASGLKSEVSDLEKELNELDKELTRIMSRIKDIRSQLDTVQEELAVAKGKEQAQYESMMARIKYMYENGNSTMLEMLFSSKCVAEFVSRAEFISAINDYDRKLLKEYAENSALIVEKEAQLKETEGQLSELQKDLSSKEQHLNKKYSDASNRLSDYTVKLEKAKAAAKKAEEEAKKDVKPIVPQKPSTGNSSVITDGSAVSYTEADVELLAALIECEAGYTNYDALLAVGAVVVNRMKHSFYPNTVRGVIFQPGQFPPATNGKVDQVMERGVKTLCVQAATDALNGKSNVEDCISFRAASSGRPGTVIGSNVFFF